MSVLEVIKSRRVVGNCKNTPIGDKILELVLKAARWAPSWVKTQCARYIVVRDTKIKSELASILPQFNPALNVIHEAPIVI